MSWLPKFFPKSESFADSGLDSMRRMHERILQENEDKLRKELTYRGLIPKDFNDAVTKSAIETANKAIADQKRKVEQSERLENDPDLIDRIMEVEQRKKG